MKKLCIISLLFLKSLSGEELPKHRLAEQINDSLLTTLSFGTNKEHFMLDLTEDELKNIAPGKLESYLEEHNLYTKNYPSWSYGPVERTIISSYIKDFIQDKNRALIIKKKHFGEEQVEENREAFNIPLKKVPALYNEAIKVVESFFPQNDEEQKIILRNQHNYEIKAAEDLDLNRIFIHAKLERTIQEKKIKHIRLVDSFLLIKDTTKGEYITVAEAKKMLKDAIRFEVTPKLLFNIDINRANQRFITTNYQLELFSQKLQSEELRNRVALPKEAKDELEIMYKTIPFKVDMGSNLCCNAHGEIIITNPTLTMYKREDFNKLKAFETF